MSELPLLFLVPPDTSPSVSVNSLDPLDEFSSLDRFGLDRGALSLSLFLHNLSNVIFKTPSFHSLAHLSLLLDRRRESGCIYLAFLLLNSGRFFGIF
jgi:hypothetical protein